MDETKKYYRHFKGGKYIVLAEGQDSESLIPVVVYQFGEKAFTVESWAKRIIRLVGLLARL